ncbi:hypothetical protein TSOC_013695, partial [Tetrabaena socialis]
DAPAAPTAAARALLQAAGKRKKAPPTPPNSPLPPSPSLPPSPPPLPPVPPPSPPFSPTTRAALLGFAAASRVASYDYTAGVLVLAEARWYGVYGKDVTVTYMLPYDAPTDAVLLPYPLLVLPYQELADLNIDVAVDFSPPPPAPPAPPAPSTPPYYPGLSGSLLGQAARDSTPPAAPGPNGDTPAQPAPPSPSPSPQQWPPALPALEPPRPEPTKQSPELLQAAGAARTAKQPEVWLQLGPDSKEEEGEAEAAVEDTWCLPPKMPTASRRALQLALLRAVVPAAPDTPVSRNFAVQSGLDLGVSGSTLSSLAVLLSGSLLAEESATMKGEFAQDLNPEQPGQPTAPPLSPGRDFWEVPVNEGGKEPYTLVSWWHLASQLQADGSGAGSRSCHNTVETHQQLITDTCCQHLSLTALCLYLVDVEYALGTSTNLGTVSLPTLFQLPAGTSLHLTDVIVLLSSFELLRLMSIICSGENLDSFPYTTGVVIEYGHVYFANHSSWTPSDSGTAGEGGEAVSTVEQLRRWDVSDRDMYMGQIPAYMSVTTDLALPADGSWQQVVMSSAKLLVILGDPPLEQQRGRATTLDLGGQEGAWQAPQAGAQMAHLRDILLVNLPYSSQPLDAYDLLSVGMHSFSRGSASAMMGVEPQSTAHLARCTLVVPDAELIFLLRAAVASTSGLGVPNLEALFGAGVQPRAGGDPVADALEGRLVLEYLEVGGLATLVNVTLLSASAYSVQLAAAAMDPSAPAPPPPLLLPSSRLWPPLLLYEEEVALQWGGSGTIVAQGLMDALLHAPACASTPARRTVLLLSSVHDLLSVSPPSAAEPPPLPLDGDRSPLSAAEECVVAGYPPALAGRRTFVNMQGAIGRVALSSPMQLRDLVLYNLAPGAAYPAEVGGSNSSGGAGAQLPPAPRLLGADAAWANSSLPLWLFQCARADEDLQQLLASVEHAPHSMQAAQQQGQQQQQQKRRRLRRGAHRRHLVGAGEELAVAQAGEAPAAPTAAARALLQAAGKRKKAPPSPPNPPLPSSPSLPPSPPPLPPVPPPSPPFSPTTRAALLGFAAASRVASYDYTAGVLVLAEARWYGVYGKDVTVTYRLPYDAPTDAVLLPYPPLVLPYQELADLNIDVTVDFSPPPPAAPASPAPSTPSYYPSLPDTFLSREARDSMPPAPPGPNGGAPAQQPTPPSPSPSPQQWPPPLPALELSRPQPMEQSPELLQAAGGVYVGVASGGDQPKWRVPVVAAASAVGGVAVLAALLLGILALRRAGASKAAAFKADATSFGSSPPTDTGTSASAAEASGQDSAAGAHGGGCGALGMSLAAAALMAKPPKVGLQLGAGSKEEVEEGEAAEAAEEEAWCPPPKMPTASRRALQLALLRAAVPSTAPDVAAPRNFAVQSGLDLGGSGTLSSLAMLLAGSLSAEESAAMTGEFAQDL